MATTTINNKSVQCNLMLEKQIDHGDLKLIQKRSKLVQCKPPQCNVHTSTQDLANIHSIFEAGDKCKRSQIRNMGKNTDFDEKILSPCLGRVLYTLRTINEFRCLRYEVR